MLTGKQKSYLRSLANTLNATHQIGKEGVSSNLISDVLNYLNKHELMKVSILQNCSMDKEEIEAYFKEADIEIVSYIGRTFILYKHSDNVKEPIIFK